MSPAISNAYSHMDRQSVLTIENKDPNDIENGLQVGYTLAEMTARAEGFLRGIGLVKKFAPIVYVVAHGSSSANNPHHGAHDCGACSGRPGATNARVMAFILNPGIVTTATNKKVPCAIADNFVLAPAFILAVVLTITDVIGKPPINPESILPMPCAFNSVFALE